MLLSQTWNPPTTDVDVEFGDAPVAVASGPGPSPTRRYRHSSPVVHEVGVERTVPNPDYGYSGETRPTTTGTASSFVGYGRPQERPPSRDETSSRYQPYPPERYGG